MSAGATTAASRGTTAQASAPDETAELLRGLTAPQKQVSPKYFYDARGSELFEQICRQPEYYPTRTELRIMREQLAEMAVLLGERAAVIEYGSGASVKTRLLLDELTDAVAYTPIDISGDFLAEVAIRLAADYPDIEILPVCADFTQPLVLPRPRRAPARRILYFPGSTIGNFSRAKALELLEQMHAQVGPRGGLLIGVDLIKDREILEPAYNDAAGVTAEFNLNLLRHLNREFAGDFDLSAFRHEAVYDENNERIEMRLVSLSRQSARLQDTAIEIEEGEYIVTEHSHKYSPESFARLAGRAGFAVRRIWTDPSALFSVQYLEAA